jgi:hypothetical protein
MTGSTTLSIALTANQAVSAHPNSSFGANFACCGRSIKSRRQCVPSITRNRPAEEMEEKEKCQQNSPIGQFPSSEQRYIDRFCNFIKRLVCDWKSFTESQLSGCGTSLPTTESPASWRISE